jgi:hypothetical protein
MLKRGTKIIKSARSSASLAVSPGSWSDIDYCGFLLGFFQVDDKPNTVLITLAEHTLPDHLNPRWLCLFRIKTSLALMVLRLRNFNQKLTFTRIRTLIELIAFPLI